MPIHELGSLQELGSPVGCQPSALKRHQVAQLGPIYANTGARKPHRLPTYSPKMLSSSTTWPHPQPFMPIHELGSAVGCQPTALKCYQVAQLAQLGTTHSHLCQYMS